MIRKRAIDRRPTLQVGLGVTASVFLALLGIMVFERIMLFFPIVGLAYQSASDIPTFLYGDGDGIGPWDCMALVLVGLCFAQAFRAWQAWRSGESRMTGLILGACNIAMISLFSFGLLINWAFFNPEEWGAESINALGGKIGYQIERSDLAYDPYTIENGWEKIDPYTYRHEDMGLIAREEIIKFEFPIDHQRANFEARYPGQDASWIDEGVRATHYYDLDGSLITIMAADLWPIVKQRLADARRPEWDADNEVWNRVKAFEEKRAAERSGTRDSLYSYEEILEMVEASWDDIDIAD
ncbi:MAG: hypothetical protein AAF583_11495 [Pseudomonadota bacterium]